MECQASGPTLPEPFRTWNDTGTDYPRDKTVAQLFEEVVAATSGATALTFNGYHVTYDELNVRANHLAHRLRRIGVGPEVMVGCCVERSIELIVALLGVLKAGGAYVPIDPSYPKERLDFLIADTRTPIMLTQSALATTALAGRDIPFFCVDEPETSMEAGDDLNPSTVCGPESLAYVMYTSGSTGKPKGVMVENRAIVRLVRNTNYCNFGPDEVFLQFASVSFDAATLEIWGPLLNGGRLVVMPPRASSLPELGQVIREQGITTLWLTAGLFNLMVEQQLEDLRSVRQLLAGGDVLSPRHVRMALEGLPNCHLINGYGPTENTTFTCCHVIDPGQRVPESIPIGRPISNTQVYVLDEQLQPVLPGAAGEICAGGDGVARGYLNNAEATAEKFLPNPFGPEAGGRMYRTGDRARWRDDGIIEFMGRIDNQVKIHGHRIEPGEIETILRMSKDVKEVCVVPHEENGSKCLVAYYVPSQNSTIAPGELRQFLVRKLPHYMIPALYVQLASMPLSANGKVDRTAMPAPQFAPKTDRLTQSPSTHLERLIAGLWQRILRTDAVGMDDNFFDLGGDSLLLVAVHSNLQKTLRVEVPVTDLFEFTTVRTLAGHLGNNQPSLPSFSEVQQQAQRQRHAFVRERERKGGCTL